MSLYVGLYSRWDVATGLKTGWNWMSDDRRPIPHAGWGKENYWGFGCELIRDNHIWYRWLIFPAWFPTCLIAFLPPRRLARSIYHSQRMRNKWPCRNRGYDLRATPTDAPNAGWCRHGKMPAAVRLIVTILFRTVPAVLRRDGGSI
jgi:hypothetical protein